MVGRFLTELTELGRVVVVVPDSRIVRQVSLDFIISGGPVFGGQVTPTRLHSRTADGDATNTVRDPEWTRSSVAPDHFALQQHPADQLELAIDE